MPENKWVQVVELVSSKSEKTSLRGGFESRRVVIIGCETTGGGSDLTSDRGTCSDGYELLRSRAGGEGRSEDIDEQLDDESDGTIDGGDG